MMGGVQFVEYVRGPSAGALVASASGVSPSAQRLLREALQAIGTETDIEPMLFDPAMEELFQAGYVWEAWLTSNRRAFIFCGYAVGVAEMKAYLTRNWPQYRSAELVA